MLAPALGKPQCVKQHQLLSFFFSHQHWYVLVAKAATSHNFRILNCFIQFFNPSPWQPRKPKRQLSTPLMPSLTSFARTLGRTTSAIFWWHWAEGSRRRAKKGSENGKIHEIHVIPLSIPRTKLIVSLNSEFIRIKLEKYMHQFCKTLVFESILVLVKKDLSH